MDYYIFFEGGIDPNATIRLVNAIDKSKQIGATQIIIFFSSLGGNIYEGFLLASVIRNYTIPISIHATNHIDSIANVIYLAAKNRTSESYTKFYLHGAANNGTFDEKSLKDLSSNLKINNSRIANFVAENSKLPIKKVNKMMKNGTTISAQEAKKYAMVHDILHKEIPSGVQREDIVFIN